MSVYGCIHGVLGLLEREMERVAGVTNHLSHFSLLFSAGWKVSTVQGAACKMTIDWCCSGCVSHTVRYIHLWLQNWLRGDTYRTLFLASRLGCYSRFLRNWIIVIMVTFRCWVCSAFLCCAVWWRRSRKRLIEYKNNLTNCFCSRLIRFISYCLRLSVCLSVTLSWLVNSKKHVRMDVCIVKLCHNYSVWM